MVKNSYHTPEEYKTMPAEKLVQLFQPLILKLGRDFGDGRFSEDVRQEVTLALLNCQARFEPARGTRFHSIAAVYMRWAAKCAKMRNCSVIDISYTRYITGLKAERENPQHTTSIHADEATGYNGVDVVARPTVPFTEPAYSSDDLSETLKLIKAALKAKYPAAVAADILRAVRDVVNGNQVHIPHRLRVKLVKAMEAAGLSKDGVLRGLALHGANHGLEYRVG